MIKVIVTNTIRSPWLEMEPLRFGAVPSGLPTRDAFVTLERDGIPWKRIDIW